MKKRNINALSVTIIASVIVMLICAVLLILQQDFGLLGGERYKNTDYTVKFVVKDSENVSITMDKELYFSNTREYFGVVRGVTYNENNEMIVTVDSKGFYKDGKFLLNGRKYIAQGSQLSIMNNNIQIVITNIY